jgi:hypothetical protein
MALFGMFFTNQRSQLGYLSLDVLATENISLQSDVTKYPIEDGSGDMTDFITAHNEELKINGAISASDTFGMEFGPMCYSKMIDAIDQLRKMHKERKLITVVTGLGKYEEMAICDLQINRNNTGVGGQWLTIDASLRKIIKVALKKADLPPDAKTTSGDGKGKSGKTEQKTTKSSDTTTSDPLAGGVWYQTGKGRGNLDSLTGKPIAPGGSPTI